MAILRNLHRDRSFLCSSVRSFAYSAASTLGRSWVCSVLSVGRSFTRSHARLLVCSFVCSIVCFSVSHSHDGLWCMDCGEQKFSTSNLKRENVS